LPNYELDLKMVEREGSDDEEDDEGSDGDDGKTRITS
jgi:hypothetical protein